MLARLRHHRIIRRHDQHGQINARGPGEHVLDKALVPRHVDDAKPEFAQVQDGKAYINGDSASFLLR